jgi:hypothetical protein
MKKFTLIVFAVLTANLIISQTPSIAWSKGAGGTLPDECRSVVADGFGNIYITGTFRSASITFGSTVFTSPGTTTHFYIAKYDGAGNCVWAKDAVGNSNEGYRLKADATGNVYLTGVFSGAMTLGSFTVVSQGGLDIFIAKLDASGNILWLKTAGGTTSEFPDALSLDNSGNIYVAGKYTSSLFTFGTFTVSNSNLFDIFVAKLDASGNALWLDHSSTLQNEGATALGCDASGNVYVGGFFADANLVFGTHTLTNVNPGYEDLFLVKYDGSGNVLWANSAGSQMYESVESLVVTSSGVHIIGYFGGSSIVFGTNTLTSAGSSDVFIVKYDAAGNVIWTKREGGSGAETAGSIAADMSGNLYAGIGFGSSSIVIGSNTYTNSGGRDMALVKYDAGGNVFWCKAMSGTGDDDIHSVSASGTDVLIAGDYDGPSLNFDAVSLTNAGGTDIFVAKIASTTGIMEIARNERALFFPNPSTGIVNFQTQQTPDGFEVYNALNELILKKDGRSQFIDLTAKANGVYFIRIVTGEQISVFKIIKQ